MFCNPVKLMLCYKLNTSPDHHRHTAMNLYEIISAEVYTKLTEEQLTYASYIGRKCRSYHMLQYIETNILS